MRRAKRMRRHLWWWFLVPLGSLGFGTFAIIGYAGIRLRSRWTILSALGYFGVVMWYFVDLNGRATVSTPDAIALLTGMFGGAAHALYLSYLFSRQLAADQLAAAPVEPSVAVARATIARRREARRILEQDPILAAELRIGRPDLHRTYDDGGLVDVNHVPAETLVAALEMSPEVAGDVVELRAMRGGFFSPEDLMIACERLNPDRLDVIRDRLVFTPRDSEFRRALE